ncbi:Protein tyrosine kinase Protein kinase domain [Trypanosoma vivax]|nr:Protein tyrosine kinase Protein kinase domain [Trypanosoma vivax]
MVETLQERCILGREVALSRVLGSGANGVAYLAKPTQQPDAPCSFQYPELFVVKVMRREVWPASSCSEVMREVSAIRSLNNPFVVRYVGAWLEVGSGEHKGSMCLAMEYCNGGDLHNLIYDYAARGKHAPNDLAMMVILQVLSALNHSHAHHIIHRDIKPANVLLELNTDGKGVARALVGDFGLARPLHMTAEMARTRVGTPCYCSPQIAAGESYTSKTDIFSAGATFFELLTLQRPFWEKNFTERDALRAIVRVDPTQQLRLAAGGRYDPCLVRVVEACLQKKEAKRPTALQLLTSFSSQLTKCVRELNLPVRADGVKMSPVRRVSPITPARRPSPRGAGGTPLRRVTPKRPPSPRPQSPVHAAVPQAAAAREGATEVVECGGLTTKLLLSFMKENTDDAAGQVELQKLLGGDVEAFLLLQVLLVTRCSDVTSLENGVFKLFMSLKPRIAVEPVMLWMFSHLREQ